MARLLSVLRVAGLMEEERALLHDVVRVGSRLVGHLGADQGPLARHGDVAARFLFRRWLLEALLLLRVRGPLGFNDLARALGGLAGESLAPKLRDLEAAGFVRRTEHGGRPRRTSYALTERGSALGSGVYALTRGKAEHALALAAGAPGIPVFVEASPPGAPSVEGLLGSFAEATRRFTDLHARRTTGADGEEGLATARRFSAACVHKWHGPVLFALATAGPMRFGDLRRALGAGDQALASALRSLALDHGSVERPAGRDPLYRISALGRFDVALGAPLVLLVPPGVGVAAGHAPGLHGP